MHCIKHVLWEVDEYNYSVKGQFIPFLMSYVHNEDENMRPSIIIAPGGSYCFVTSAEGDNVAKEFYKRGFNTFVIVYSTNPMFDQPLHLQPLKDISRAVLYIRKNADHFRTEKDKIAICGFSAGGHLCASLAVHHQAKELISDIDYFGVSNRPNALILGYPVITSNEYGHQNSFTALFGNNPSQSDLDYMSLEKHVSIDSPPTFLWHTVPDVTAPLENSLLYAQACRRNGVPFELHIFGNGKHGISLANEEWAKGEYQGDYCTQQYYETIKYLVHNQKGIPKQFEQIRFDKDDKDAQLHFAEIIRRSRTQCLADSGISIWPSLVEKWMNKLFMSNKGVV